ncbi:hypothetical protein AB1N83_008423, partial [Pleurotus pulmonarius]
SVRKSKIYAK